MVLIKDDVLKKVRKLLENALKEAQKGYNEADNMRKSAHVSDNYNYHGDPGISEADAREAVLVWEKTTKDLVEKLHQIAIFVEKNL